MKNINKLDTNCSNNVAMMQPSFLPWQGFFELIYASDSFIFLDNFQFSVQSRHTRGHLLDSNGSVGTYIVPIQKSKSYKHTINETLLCVDNYWKNKMFKRLANTYSKAQYFNEIHPHIVEWLQKDYVYLSELNISFIRMVCDLLNIKRKFLFSSSFSTTSTRSKRVLELLEWANAGKYLSAFGSFDYMKEDKIFPCEDICVVFQNVSLKPYQQIKTKEFVPYLSILDALYNIGKEESLKLISSCTDNWLTWEERDNA